MCAALLQTLLLELEAKAAADRQALSALRAEVEHLEVLADTRAKAADADKHIKDATAWCVAYKGPWCWQHATESTGCWHWSSDTTPSALKLWSGQPAAGRIYTAQLTALACCISHMLLEVWLDSLPVCLSARCVNAGRCEQLQELIGHTSGLCMHSVSEHRVSLGINICVPTSRPADSSSE
jgi:hypothetical protein